MEKQRYCKTVNLQRKGAKTVNADFDKNDNEINVDIELWLEAMKLWRNKMP